MVANAEFTDLVASTGSTLQELTGIGPSGAGVLLASTIMLPWRNWDNPEPVTSPRARLDDGGTAVSGGRFQPR